MNILGNPGSVRNANMYLPVNKLNSKNTRIISERMERMEPCLPAIIYISK